MNTPLRSALYTGSVTHHRLRPRTHQLSYHIFSFLLDLDELDSLDHRLRLFSLNRFNLFSFCERDRGDGSERPLRVRMEETLRAAGFESDGGAIKLLTIPRLLGWAFNPLSVFFCYRCDGSPLAILWEVDNTFGQRHGYLIPVTEETGATIKQSCDKAFYVSPFMDMDLRYTFSVDGPNETLRIIIEAHDSQGLVLRARQLGRRVTRSDGALLRVFLDLAFVTVRVVAGIAWEALKIRLKGIRTRPRPVPPDALVSIISNHRETAKGRARV